ncbi:hypothetical protein P8452_61225 [Trifolium repens]|nr:hypothetical protein P8452_61225 [Trifolium repens]
MVIESSQNNIKLKNISKSTIESTSNIGIGKNLIVEDDLKSPSVVGLIRNMFLQKKIKIKIIDAKAQKKYCSKFWVEIE